MKMCEKVKRAIEAQEMVIKELRGFKRVLIVHIPGIIVGLVMPFFLLLSVLSMSGLVALRLHGLLALFFLSLMLLLVISIVGTIILAHAFRKRPEFRYLSVLLNRSCC